jgi:hypothetical protein
MQSISLFLTLILFQFFAYGEECVTKDQSTLEIKSGNIDALSSSISVVFKDKAYTSLRYLIQVAGNAEAIDANQAITQQELQETLRYIYADKLSYDDLMRMQKNLLVDKNFLKLTPFQQADAKKVLGDITDVEAQMNLARTTSNLNCRFAFTDNPLDDLPKKGIQVESGRMVRAVCWHKKN